MAFPELLLKLKEKKPPAFETSLLCIAVRCYVQYWYFSCLSQPGFLYCYGTVLVDRWCTTPSRRAQCHALASAVWSRPYSYGYAHTTTEWKLYKIPCVHRIHTGGCRYQHALCAYRLKVHMLDTAWQHLNFQESLSQHILKRFPYATVTITFTLVQ